MRRIRFPDLLALAVCLAAPASHAAPVGHAAFDYLTHCGGCHGIEGDAGDSGFPSLRNRVGVFACSPEGRAYIAQVPGVANSLIRDDQAMADVMNFVLFKLAGTSLPPGTKPYTAAEIHRLRVRPNWGEDVLSYRASVLGRTLPLCQALRRGG